MRERERYFVVKFLEMGCKVFIGKFFDFMDQNNLKTNRFITIGRGKIRKNSKKMGYSRWNRWARPGQFRLQAGSGPVPQVSGRFTVPKSPKPAQPTTVTSSGRFGLL